MKRWICFFLLAISSALVGKAWHTLKDGFQIRRTFSQMPLKMENVSSPLVEKALAQPYSYLGRGHQCYAFGSEDGKYVIKLPRFDRYRLSFFLRVNPFGLWSEYREKIRDDLERRKAFLMESFRIAFEDLREETALLYVHLNETKNLKGSLLIQDRIGRKYKLDPNQTAFLLQEKKPIMMPFFERFLKEGKRKEAQELLDSFLQFISTRARRGIYNKDPSFLRNFGWDMGKAVQIDIGSFYRKPWLSKEEACEKSFQETIQHVRNWLAELDPSIVEVFDEKTQKVKNSWD